MSIGTGNIYGSILGKHTGYSIRQAILLPGLPLATNPCPVSPGLPDSFGRMLPSSNTHDSDTMKISLLIICLTFSGCALVEKGLVNLLTPNPENKRIEAQTKATETAHRAINEANTPEKVKAHAEVHRMAGKQSHPSFFSSVVSGLYTEEGRRLAGVAVVALGLAGGFIWKTASTWGLPGKFANLVRGVQDVKEEYPKGSPERMRINNILKRRQQQSGIWAKMDKKVKKILGEV